MDVEMDIDRDSLREIVDEEIVHAKFNSDKGVATFTLQNRSAVKQFAKLTKSKTISPSEFIREAIYQSYEKAIGELNLPDDMPKESFGEITLSQRPSSGKLVIRIHDGHLRDRLREIKIGHRGTLSDVLADGIETAYEEFDKKLREKGINAVK